MNHILNQVALKPCMIAAGVGPTKHIMKSSRFPPRDCPHRLIKLGVVKRHLAGRTAISFNPMQASSITCRKSSSPGTVQQVARHGHSNQNEFPARPCKSSPLLRQAICHQRIAANGFSASDLANAIITQRHITVHVYFEGCVVSS
ncbi:MAG: hypothetical protein R3E42_09230 [Burkholderiaceae bacterium]